MAEGTTSMNIRIDPKVKKQSQELFSQFGLDMTTAINMFLRQSIREQAIPFELTLNSKAEIMREQLSEIKGGQNIVGPFNSVTTLMHDLNAPD